MSGRWKVKHPDLLKLYVQAQALASQFRRINYEWVPRARNTYADRLANDAMDAAAQSAAADADPAKIVATESPTSPGWTGARGTPTRLLLLRHGQTELSEQRRYSGRGNPGLNEVGWRQVGAAAGYLARRGGIAAVVSSPLQRAYDTAVTAARALALDVVVDDDLVETDFGAWEGLTFAEAAERDPELHRRWLQDTSITPPGGKASTTCCGGFGGDVIGSSLATKARRCWWCHMSRRSKCCCGWRWMPGRASYIGCILIWHR